MLATVFKKQWMDLQGRLWTYPILAFCLLLGERGFELCGLVAVFMALDLATQTAGDDARHGTFEFIFTRAIDRRAYLRSKFLFGPPLIIAFVLLVGGLEAIGAREMFWNLVMEPVTPVAPPGEVTWGLLAFAASALILLFGLVFAFVIGTTSEASFVSLNVLGLGVCGGYQLAVAALVPHLMDLPSEGLRQLLADARFAGVASAASLVPVFVLYLASREFYARRRLPPAVARNEQQSGGTGWIVLIILLLLLLVVFMYLLLGHAPVEPGLTGKGS